MRQYLAEGAKGGFQFLVDRTRPFVTESRPTGNITRIPGRFSVCDHVNGNNRRYGRRVWEKNLTAGSPLQESIKRNAAFGLLEHPEDGKVSLLSPISHLVTRAELVESVDADGAKTYEVHGEIVIAETAEGKKLKALIDVGHNPLVSSRGYGSLTRASDGVDDVGEDFTCESWDVVIKPSFTQAELIPDRSGTASRTESKLETSKHEVKATPASTSVVTESATGAKVPTRVDPSQHDNVCSTYGLCSMDSLLKSNPGGVLYALPNSVAFVQGNKSVVHKGKDNSNPPDADKEMLHTFLDTLPSSRNSTPNTESQNSMNLNDIKSRMAALRGVDPALNPQRFAESVAEAESLHTQIDRFIAEDASTRNYIGSKLHRQLDQMTAKWNESAQAPAKQAKRLQENNSKLIKVVHATAKTGLLYKNKLSEALNRINKGETLAEELTKRGQGWRQLAEDRREKLQHTSKHFDTACEALDIMAERYHRDTVELGRRLMVLEFGEKAQTPSVQKALKEATRLRHLAAIRESLEEGQVPTNESVTAPKSAAKPAPGKPRVAESASVTLTSSERNPRLMTESVEMVRRMSAVTAK